MILIVCGVNLNGKHKKLSRPFFGVGFSATPRKRNSFVKLDNFVIDQ
jgi:hypothetical protein